MLTPDNIFTFIAIGLSIVVISAIFIAGSWGELKIKKTRREHSRISTNYARYQARLAVTNEVIVKGTL